MSEISNTPYQPVTMKELKYLYSCEMQAKLFSTCGKRQYFALVIDGNGHIVGTGYNGGPSGTKHCNEGGCPRLAEGSAPGSNYDNCIAIHAEANALLHSDYSERRDGRGTIFVNGTPCYSCAKLIANSYLDRVVCIADDTYEDWPRVRGELEDWGVAVCEVPRSLLARVEKLL